MPSTRDTSGFKLARSPVNIARLMIILGLRSEGPPPRDGLLKRLDRSSARAFEEDVRSLIRPWMWWLGLPLAVIGLGLTFLMKTIGGPAPLTAAVGWMFALDSPLATIAVFSYLAVLRYRRVDVRRELTENGFVATLLNLSVMAHCAGASIGLVGALLLPEIFTLG